MIENPLGALLILAFIALLAYIGNRNSNKKVETKIYEENIVIPKEKQEWHPESYWTQKYERMAGKNEQS